MTEIEGWQTLDDKGVKMPWYTRPCLEWLDKLDLKGKRVFEYGAGNSTLWYVSRGSISHGVDHDIRWRVHEDIDVPPTRENYLLSITLRKTKFDIIVIDGIYRDECLQYALEYINKGGFIIIDNWKQATADLEEWPITEKLIEGMDVTIYKEPTHQDWQTLVIHV